MEDLVDAHYFTLPSQGNIYTLTKLSMSNGINKILAASLRRKVYLFEYSIDENGSLTPMVKEIQFTYIPGGAEIISIDAFSKSQTSNDFVIGITITKSGDDNSETYLHIYSEWDSSSEFSLENAAQNCLMLELSFVPYQLCHAELVVGGAREVVWLLSGSDHKVHVFREDSPNHSYSEASTADFFPELSDAPSVVTSICMRYDASYSRRISAFGCNCGYVKVSVVSVEKREVVSSWDMRFEGFISSVQLFTVESLLRCPSFVELRDEAAASCDQEPPLNLLVTCVVENAITFMDVLNKGFSCVRVLVGSAQFDAVLCSLAADIDMDGQKEILIGTFGQELLVYKLKTEADDSEWQLLSQRTFANPIQAMMYLDVSGDGVRELIALTLRGVHVMQHDSKIVEEKFMSRFNSLKLKIPQCEDAS
ncbi:KICSTOR complex protein kaptin-like [Bacillus rossius redtenbacheri]|uniref:KICSTOR complex protein kaptin-like n=1 Tax=Bacillus rossius redtenbacheri TaxID=93214 RepID=UPI002FDE358F